MKTGKYHWVTERPLKLGKKEGLWADNSKSKAQASRGPQHVNNHRHLDQISHGFPSHPSSETGTLLCMQFKACLRLGTLLSHWVLASQVCRYTLISTIFIVVFLFPCSYPPPFYFIYVLFLFVYLAGCLDFCFVFIFFARMHVCAPHACSAHREGCQFPWTLSYGWLWAVLWVMGIEPGFL